MLGMRTTFQMVSAGRTVVARVAVADGFWLRARGLIGRPRLAPGAGLWLPSCPAVHTLFMDYPLDLIFLDRAQRVVRLQRHVTPGRMAAGGGGSVSVVEVAAGWLPAEVLRPGDAVTFEPAASPAQ